VSSSKRTKHIKARYFLIKDYYGAGEIDIKFCPTDKMWADILTKPLQGQKFRDMWVFLQNCPQGYDNDNKIKQMMNPQDVASSWECVDEHAKSLLKFRTVSPTCVSHITNSLPGRKNLNASCILTWGSKHISFTPHRPVNGSLLLTRATNKLRTFPVNSNFPIRRTQELRHGKINESGVNCQPHNFPVPSKGQTKAEKEFGVEVRSITIT
jgi:hypothetical protein